MESNKEHIDLIIRYFAGEISAGELQVLSSLLKSDPELRKEFEAQGKIWESVNKLVIKNSVDTAAEWRNFQNRIAKYDPKLISLEQSSNKRNSLKYIQIAASIIFIAAVGFVLYYYVTNGSNSQIQIAATDKIIESTLPDGSVVSLNENSKIEYPKNFTKEKRSVKLSGQAFFDVAHDKSSPFIIDAGDLLIEVVGTSFFVKTEADGKALVVVSSGKVAVCKKANIIEKTFIEKGEKAEFEKEQEKIVKSANDDENFISWKTHRFVFKDKSLVEIITQLNSVYKSNIRIDNDLVSDCRITATFDNQPLDAVLKVIEATVNVKISGTANNFVITGNGCR